MAVINSLNKRAFIKGAKEMLKTHNRFLGLAAGFLLIVSTGAWAAVSENPIGLANLKPAEFLLTVEDHQWMSLRAREASLQAIVQEIGRKMGIKVVGTIPKDETVTMTFSRLPVADALQHLSPNYGYQIGHENGEEKIATIFVLPQPKGFVRPQPIPGETQRDESTASMVSETTDAVKILPRETANQSDEKEPVRPAPFGFAFDPSAFQK